MKSRQEQEKTHRLAVGGEPADRPISPLRTDLRIAPQLFYGQLCFVIKDPVTLRYYRLQPVEHYLLTQLGQGRTARDLLGILQQQFPDSSLTLQDVVRFVGMLHESHLLVGEGVAHAVWLSERRGTTRRRRWAQAATNFLFAKVPLFNPERLLTRLEKHFGRLVFSPLTGLLVIALMLLAVTQLLWHIDKLTHSPYNLLAWDNLAILYVVFICTKVFHEFGHGWACKHFGGEVSQMGMLWMVFSPAFYCDTSDAWMIPSRRVRLWINAGGVVVELVLAAVATLVWANTPGATLINQMALNVMISCSVATLFFNANPLLRYDGYYFLADALEIPNLMSKGVEFLKYYAQRYLLGLKPPMPPDRRRLKTLVSYAVTSTVYRWLVVFGIVVVLYWFFAQHGLAPIGVLLCTGYVFLSILLPMLKGMAFLWKQRWNMSKRLGYVLAATSATTVTMVLVAGLPWNMTIRQPLVVLSEQDEPITVKSPGYLEAVHADMGATVHRGELIAELQDPALETQLSKALARHDQALLVASTARTENKPAELAAAMTAVRAFDQQIALLRQRQDELMLRAPIDGTVVRDTPLKWMVGNHVATGVKLCRVIQTDRLQARISLPQQEAALVKAGMAVRIRLWADAGRPLAATVARISSSVNDQLVHPALSTSLSGEVPVTEGKDGQPHSASLRSTVIIHLPQGAGTLLADGMTGRGEIMVRQTTVGGRLWRLLLDSTTPDWHL